MEQRVPSPRRYTVQEYFDLEHQTDERLEYIDGYIYLEGQRLVEGQLQPDGRVLGMSGGTVNHSRIGSNTGRTLGNRLVGTPCEVFEARLRVHVGRIGRYVHPDVTVVCGPVELDPNDDRGETVLNPRLIVEVLSRSTEMYDRTDKAELFRAIPSLQEYVFVDQRRPRAETFYRSADGVWSFGPTVTDPAASVPLRSLGIDLPLDEVYARVVFPPPGADAP